MKFLKLLLLISTVLFAVNIIGITVKADAADSGILYTSEEVSKTRLEAVDATESSDNTINDTESGFCGAPGNEKNVTWIYEDRVLIISGTGAMADYEPHRQLEPWHYYYHNIRKIVIEEGITHIGDASFLACSVNQVAFPKTLTSIGKYAFYGCDSLEEINLPPNIISIGEHAFWISSINKVIISEGVNDIGFMAFGDGDTIDNAYIPGSMKNVGNIGFTKGILDYISYIIFGEGVETVESSYQIAAETIYLPESVNYIRLDSLYCSILYGKNDVARNYAEQCDWDIIYIDASGGIDINDADIQLDNIYNESSPDYSVTYEGVALRENVDYEVVYLKDSTSEKAITTFTGKGVYRGTRDIEYTVEDVENSSESSDGENGGGIGDEEISKGETAKGGDNNSNQQETKDDLNAGTIENNRDKKAANDNSEFTDSLDEKNNLTADNNQKKSNDNTVTYRKNKYRIINNKKAAFVMPENNKIKKLVIPDTIKIKNKKYKVTAIDSDACNGLKNLNTVKVGNNVQTVGKFAFANCKKLKKITFGKGLLKLEQKVLSGDTHLKKITFKSTKIKSFGKKTFDKVPRKVDIVIPRVKMTKYVKLIKKAK